MKSKIIANTVSDIFYNNKKVLKKQEFVLPNRKHSSKRELELALTVLLVEISSSDQNFDQREYITISNGLKRLFGTTRDEVKALVNQANLVLANLRGTGKFATLLSEELTTAEREVIAEIIDQVILADSVEDGFESYLRNKYRSLLFPDPTKNS